MGWARLTNIERAFFLLLKTDSKSYLAQSNPFDLQELTFQSLQEMFGQQCKPQYGLQKIDIYSTPRQLHWQMQPAEITPQQISLFLLLPPCRISVKVYLPQAIYWICKKKLLSCNFSRVLTENLLQIQAQDCRKLEKYLIHQQQFSNNNPSWSVLSPPKWEERKGNSPPGNRGKRVYNTCRGWGTARKFMNWNGTQSFQFAITAGFQSCVP
jgi:hypothetical protein